MLSIRDAIVKAKDEVEDTKFTGVVFDLPNEYIVKLVPSQQDVGEVALDPFYSVNKDTGVVDLYPVNLENIDEFSKLDPVHGFPEELIDQPDPLLLIER